MWNVCTGGMERARDCVINEYQVNEDARHAYIYVCKEYMYAKEKPSTRIKKINDGYGIKLFTKLAKQASNDELNSTQRIT